MINIDYLVSRTQNVRIIQRIFNQIHSTFTERSGEKGWKKYITYKNCFGVTLRFRKNKFDDLDLLFVGFSAHTQINGGVHNADFRTLAQTQRSIINVFASLGISRLELIEFGVSSIEIASNFWFYAEPRKVLDAALMFDKHFYQIHAKYKHYKSTKHKNENYKYIKGKFYIKSAQIDSATGLTNFQLDFCGNNVLRIEFKLERASKFKFMNFSTLESLLSGDAEMLLNNFFMNQLDKIFFYSPSDIIKKNLKHVQWKHIHQWEVPSFWTELGARKLKSEKKFYNLLPKKYNLKEEIVLLFLDKTKRQKKAMLPTVIEGKKMSIFLPYEIIPFRTPFITEKISSVNFCPQCIYLGIGKQTLTND